MKFIVLPLPSRIFNFMSYREQPEVQYVYGGGKGCVSVCERVCVCAREREREREGVCERENVCVRVCVCARVSVHVCLCLCLCLCLRLCVLVCGTPSTGNAARAVHICRGQLSAQ